MKEEEMSNSELLNFKLLKIIIGQTSANSLNLNSSEECLEYLMNLKKALSIDYEYNLLEIDKLIKIADYLNGGGFRK
jgi:hypothetical protein